MTPTPSPCAPTTGSSPGNVNRNLGQSVQPRFKPKRYRPLNDEQMIQRFSEQPIPTSTTPITSPILPYRVQNYSEPQLSSLSMMASNGDSIDALNGSPSSVNVNIANVNVNMANVSQSAHRPRPAPLRIHPRINPNSPMHPRIKAAPMHAPAQSTPTPTTAANTKSGRSRVVTWKTYVGHIVFHEHERGHQLYQKFAKLGAGVFARVYRTVRKSPSRAVALKVFPKKSGCSEGSFANELMLLHNVSHPNIVRFYDAHVDPKYFYLEMELCSGGDLFKHISQGGAFTEGMTRPIVFKILDAIRCFHEKDFVHRDLKPENLMFVRREDFRDIRLIDFGEAIHVEPQTMYDEYVGTPCYFAPERFRRLSGAELKKSDVWAIGVMCFEMLTGCRCFDGGKDTDTVRDNVMYKKMEPWPANIAVTDAARDFLDCLMQMNPLKRFSCEEALRHPWLAQELHEQQIEKQQQMQCGSNAIDGNGCECAPKLTALDDATVAGTRSHEMAPQSIVIKTSQSMSDLKSGFREQWEHRQKLRKMERKYNDSAQKAQIATATSTSTDDRVDAEHVQHGKPGPFQVSVSRMKSRSLEEEQFADTLGPLMSTLSLPKKPKRAAVSLGNKTSVGVMAGPKLRSNTLGNPNERTSAMLIGKSMAVDLPIATVPPIPMGLLRHRKTHSSPSMVNGAMAMLTEDSAVTAMSISEQRSDTVSSGQHSDGYVDGYVKTYTASTTTPPTQISNTSSLSLSSHGVGGWPSVSGYGMKHTAHSVSGSFSIQTLSGVRDVLEDEIMD